MLFGIMGQKGSGKDTCADFLIENHNYIKFSFADCLKRACKEIFLLSDEQLYGTIQQKETPDPRWHHTTPRKIMQYVGTDLLRNNLNTIMPGIGMDVFIHHFRI